LILGNAVQKLYDDACFLLIWELGFLYASGPRVVVPGVGLVKVYSYSVPCEDVQLKS